LKFELFGFKANLSDEKCGAAQAIVAKIHSLLHQLERAPRGLITLAFLNSIQSPLFNW
jgi:hypothetical protein